ncbi:zinc finger protein JAGGED-like isoform X2 [Vitis riparia]|uniref:zinc finger protein JAGGED-like isoform X2 n=1 Tax=Vitis riparia TaxID=96939 RepID=UPI00155A126A|nr:zinc finger protein JAGGED-like isoform X2 [Vitis riparia]
MRPERNPLDLNNLPEDFTRDGKQVFEDSSSSGCRKKKSGGKDGKDECGKVYECRFCSLKFCKSQALGGHMNRHRQERETETLNRARQIVFSNENLAAQGPHLGGQPIAPGSFHQTGNMGDPTLPFRSVYPTRMFSGSSSTLLTPPPQPYLYASPSRLVSYPSQYPPPSMNDYYVGHVLSSGSQYSHPGLNYGGASDSNYTCIGAPVGHGFPPSNGGGRGSELGGSGGGGGGGGGGGRDGSLQNQEEGLNWGRSYAGSQQRMDPSLINRFQDGF